MFLVLNLVIAVILEKSELSDAQKKKIQKVIMYYITCMMYLILQCVGSFIHLVALQAEYLKHLKSRQNRLLSSKGSGTWLVGAVEGATARVKSISDRLYTKKVKAISIPISKTEPGSKYTNMSGQHSTINKTSPAIVPGGANAQHSNISFPPDSIGSSTSTSYAGQDTPSTSSAVPQNLTQRSSQMLQSIGFSFGSSTPEAPGTALRKSILALVNDGSSDGPTEVLGQDEELSVLKQQQSKKVVTRSESRASFQLEEFEELGRSFSLREKTPWYLSDTSLFLFSPENSIRVICQKIVESRLFTLFITCSIIISVVVVITMSQTAPLAPLFAHLNQFVFAVRSLTRSLMFDI